MQMSGIFKTINYFAWLSVCCLPLCALAQEAPTRLLMMGDILLSREVQREITLKHLQSPWVNMQSFFTGADWVMGNFEGSVGNHSNCPDTEKSLCFPVTPASLIYPKNAGFTAMSIENNHSTDLGPESRKQTRSALLDAGIAVIDYGHSPGFFKNKGRIISFVSLSNISGRHGKKTDIPSHELRQKIRLAKSLSDWVIVNVHWGTELTDWPQPKQKSMASWLINEGADLIIGHHPHVVQPPECIQGKPVFFSLGNHVFDQKYPETKRGMIAECIADSNQLSCKGIYTETPSNSAFPAIRDIENKDAITIESCKVQKSSAIVINDYRIRPRLAENQFVDGEIVLEGKKQGVRNWNTPAKQLLTIQKGHLTREQGKDFLFTLETHLSSIDKEIGPRPYVYEVTPKGLVAKWRGSALAWPLVDGKLIHTPKSGDIDYLCALHRKDSFVTLNPTVKETRTAVYQWNGFGFSGVEDPALSAECENAFKLELNN